MGIIGSKALKMSNRKISVTMIVLILAISFVLGGGHSLLADEEGAPAPQVSKEAGQGLPVDGLEAGERIYKRLCISCHGVEGAGDGPAADILSPKPRSFKAAQFKYRTTPRDRLPTDDDLFKVVTNGLPGTGMPDWADVLLEKERKQVIQFIKTFSPKWKELKESLPVLKVGEQIPPSEESIKKGKGLFTSLGCIGCHGVEGRGDGALSLVLKDHRGDPVFPRDLTKNWLFRGGGEAKDIYVRINTGINGTPMPSFADRLDNEKSWAVANYVRSLSPKKNPERPSSIKSRHVDGVIPTGPDDPLWQEGEFSWIQMMGQISWEKRLFTPTVTDILVKSLYNDKEIGFLLVWNDRSNSKATPAKGTSPEIYSDQVAIQFPERLQPDGVTKPYFIMGDKKLGVNLWTWRAEKNQFVESNANGILNEERFQETSDVTGEGYFKNGQYRLVMKRSLRTDDAQKDIQFGIGQFYPIAFYAWDGTNGETATKRSITPWFFVWLERGVPKSVYLYPPIVAVAIFSLQIFIKKTLRKNNHSASHEER